MSKKNQEIDTGISLYDINKSLMKDEKPLDPIAFNRAIKKTSDSILASFKKYWMLLSNERKDYTVFIINGSKGLQSELKETIENRGQILSIKERKDDGNFEIWVRDPETDENFIYYLFDYTFGIIEV